MITATNISANIKSYFNGLNNRVVQKGDIGGYYSYALQLMKKQTLVYRTKNALRADFKTNRTRPILRLSGSAAGHTQTWEYANKTNTWFVGTKATHGSLEHWDKQIARVTIPDYTNHTSNTQLARLSYLTQAGGFKIPDNQYLRSEASVSPNHDTILFSVVDKTHTCYFSLYSLKVINDALDKNGNRTDTRLDKLPYIDSFKVDINPVGSLQGFGIDEQKNIYISSQHPGATRKIVKIPWKVTDNNQWVKLPLDDINLDRQAKYSEFEGIQVLGYNHLYLNISYHKSDGKTRVYDVTWDD